MPDETVDDTTDQPDPSGVADGAVDDTDTGLADPDLPTLDDPEAAGSGEEAADEPLTDEEIATLQANPDELRKAVMRAKDYTRKTSEVARMRDFARAYEQDPVGTARRFAAAHGVIPKDAASDSRTPAATVQSHRDRIAAVLGDSTADALMPVLSEMVNEIVGPDRQRVDHVLSQTALTQASSVLETFTAQYPEWKKLEPEMVKISNSIQPKKGTDPLQYMKMVYILARQSTSKADQARSLVGRVTAGVRGTEARTTGTSSSRVAERPNKQVTFDEAWSAAARGKRIEF